MRERSCKFAHASKCKSAQTRADAASGQPVKVDSGIYIFTDLANEKYLSCRFINVGVPICKLNITDTVRTLAMTRVHPYIRMRAVELHTLHVSKAFIHRILKKEGYHVSYDAVRRICNRYSSTGCYAYNQPSGRPCKISRMIISYIDRLLESDNEITAPKVQKCVAKRYGTVLSIATLKRVRRRLGWVYASARYCQFIREWNKTFDFASLKLHSSTDGHFTTLSLLTSAPLSSTNTVGRTSGA